MKFRKEILPIILSIFILGKGLGTEPAFAKAGLNVRNDSMARNFPNSVLTNDFGILSRTDLAPDIEHYEQGPYRAENTGGGAYWQCFQTKRVFAGYRVWRDNNSMGPANKTVELCEVEIRIHKPGDPNEYWDRRGHPLEFCREFKKSWETLTQKESIVCLNGEPSGVGKRHLDGRIQTVRQWTWNKFKTPKGCYSYFNEDCLREH